MSQGHSDSTQPFSPQSSVSGLCPAKESGPQSVSTVAERRKGVGSRMRGSNSSKGSGPKGMGMWQHTCWRPRDLASALLLMSHGAGAKSRVGSLTLGA